MYVPPEDPRYAPQPIPWITGTILVSTIAVFLAQLYINHHSHVDRLGDTLAFSPQAFAQHRYWTLLTYAWAHAVDIFGNPDLFWLHIVSNMLPLVWLGPLLEGVIGHIRFLALYLGGAVASALTWYFFNQHAMEGIIGASGAVFALIAAVGVLAPYEKVYVSIFFLPPIPMRLGMLAVLIVLSEIVQILFHWMRDVAHSAHLGGAAFGALYILVLRFLVRRSPWADRNLSD